MAESLYEVLRPGFPVNLSRAAIVVPTRRWPGRLRPGGIQQCAPG